MNRILKWMLASLLTLAMFVGGYWYFAIRARTPDFADLAYNSSSPAQKLDIYLPSGKGPFPVVIFAHGGAFKIGSKRDLFGDFKGNIKAMNAAGIALISIDYRMSGEARFPAAVQDMKSAIKFVRANANSYRIDPEHIALWGKSAGAHIALMAGMAREIALFVDPNSKVKDQSDRVSAVISMYGPTDFLQMDSQLHSLGCPTSDLTHNNHDSPESLYLGRKITLIPEQAKTANPLSYVSEDTPLLLLQHGGKDCTVPPGQSEILAAAVNDRYPHRATFELLKDAGHGDAVFETATNIEHVIAFIKQAFTRQSEKGKHGK